MRETSVFYGFDANYLICRLPTKLTRLEQLKIEKAFFFSKLEYAIDFSLKEGLENTSPLLILKLNKDTLKIPDKVKATVETLGDAKIKYLTLSFGKQHAIELKQLYPESERADKLLLPNQLIEKYALARSRIKQKKQKQFLVYGSLFLLFTFGLFSIGIITGPLFFFSFLTFSSFLVYPSFFYSTHHYTVNIYNKAKYLAHYYIEKYTETDEGRYNKPLYRILNEITGIAQFIQSEGKIDSFTSIVLTKILNSMSSTGRSKFTGTGTLAIDQNPNEYQLYQWRLRQYQRILGIGTKKPVQAVCEGILRKNKDLHQLHEKINKKYSKTFRSIP